LQVAGRDLVDIDLASTPEAPCELVADKGYHSREGLKDLDGGVWKTGIAERVPAHDDLRLAWPGCEMLFTPTEIRCRRGCRASTRSDG
jgi:hypothetical protein